MSKRDNKGGLNWINKHNLARQKEAINQLVKSRSRIHEYFLTELINTRTTKIHQFHVSLNQVGNVYTHLSQRKRQQRLDFLKTWKQSPSLKVLIMTISKSNVVWVMLN